MTKKADFNAEEWSQVLEGPPIAGMIVITAQRGGTLRESISMGKAYTEAREQHGSSELLDEIVGANPEIDTKQFGSAEELRTQGLQHLRDAVALLESKASADEVEGYRGFVVTLAQRVAEAHKEGGFLGVGGKEVGEAEQAALEEIKEALGA
jgi:hypothetical protein